MLDEGGMEASWLDIFSYARPLLSDPDPTMLARGNVTNSVFFILLGIGSGIATFCSGSLFGRTGEKMAMRLRMDVFKLILFVEASGSGALSGAAHPEAK
ncbi:hypothetical protein KIN20_001011 [Parelaphostrongylus tenuis]|uniref:Uncharacterized protein n=1 Tax=Parelaphostrongylus tenuis TaxID=148309 RepID=A0AAD5QBX9_PARTN|nr:hypothetical protein KIN20_001011 [Parelaphostrongylus tenuis]